MYKYYDKNNKISLIKIEDNLKTKTRFSKFKQIILHYQYLPSINSQCPVSTQIQTINNAIENDSSSAVVKRPHIPNEILKK